MIWNLTILAIGFREDIRPSSMRIGAGARLGKFGYIPYLLVGPNGAVVKAADRAA